MGGFFSSLFSRGGILVYGLLAFALPTLRARAKHDVRRHYKANRTLRLRRYRGFRALISWVAPHPGLSAAAAVVTYAVVLGATWLAFPLPFGPSEDSLKEDFRSLFLSINTTILGAQATFIGLVFPLVIALVSILSSNRIGFTGRLSVYIKESEALFVGASSLLLAGVALILLSPLPAMPPRLTVAVTVLNSAWFAVNLCGLGYFLWRTLDYLRPDKRTDMLKDYVANCAYRTDLLQLAMWREWRHAIEVGYQARPISTTLAADDRPVIGIGLGGIGNELEVVKRTTRTPREIRDVRVGVLSVVIRAWLLRANVLPRSGRRSRLEFLVEPGEDFDDEIRLVRTATEPRFAWLEQSLARSAFIVRPKRRVFSFAEIEDILRESVVDVVQLANDGRYAEFESLVRTTADTLVFIFDIADFRPLRPTDDARRTLIYDFALNIARPLIDAVDAAARQIGRSGQPFNAMAYLGFRLVTPLSGDARRSAEESALIISSAAARHLLLWGYQAASEVEQLEGGPAGLVVHTGNIERQYGGAWRDFVGAWEQLLSAFARGSRTTQPDTPAATWDAYRQRAVSSLRHLERTMHMTADAVSRGDQLAVGWTTDLLANWLGNVTLAIPGENQLWSLETDALTPAVLQSNWEVITGLDLDRNRDLPLPPGPVAVGIVENAWTDATTFLALIFLRWSIQHGSEGAAGLAAYNILHRIRNDRGGIRPRTPERLSPQDILLSILRMSNRSILVEQEYGDGLLDGRDILRLLESTPVAMRVYSYSGSSGPDAFRREQAFLLIAALSPAREDPIPLSQALRYFLTSARDDTHRRDMLRDLEILQAQLEVVGGENYFVTARRVFPDNGSEQWEQRRNRIAGLLAACVNALNEQRHQAIINAEVDPARLHAVARAAETSAFHGLTANFPVSMYQEVESRPGALPSFTWRASNQPKGAYTNPPLAPEAGDTQYWDDLMRDRVAALAMYDTLKALALPRVEVTTAEEYWAALQAAAAEIISAGRTPILVIAGWGEPQWLSDWTDEYHPAERPTDMRVWRKDTPSEGYHISINDFDVYVGEIGGGHSCMIAREALRRIEYQRQEPDEPRTTVTFTPEVADPWRGTLNLRIGRQVIVDQIAEARGRDIVFGRSDEPSPETNEENAEGGK